MPATPCARPRARHEGLAIETRIMDGHALELGDDSFDLAGSQFGVMLFPDMPRAIREMARVVKPRGRVVISAYGDPGRIDFLGFLVRAVQSVRPDFSGPPLDPPPLESQLADPARLRAEVAAADLRDIAVDTVTEATAFRTGEELWAWIVWSNPLVEDVLGHLGLTSDEECGVVRRTLEQLVRKRARGGHAAVLTNPVNIGVGTK
jgi:SAM-dependent methyltransferase